MGYKHIENLYNNLWFLNKYAEVYALEKIHGTSANIRYDGDQQVQFSSGGERMANFMTAFDQKTVVDSIINQLKGKKAVFYGEAYGGKQQQMHATYGHDYKFIVFEVIVGGEVLDVEVADKLTNSIGLEFVAYTRGPNTVEWLNEQRDRPSIQAERNGVGSDRVREGIVVRPVEDQTVTFKHKTAGFCETRSKRETKLEKIDYEAMKIPVTIVDEWAVPMRLEHVNDRFKRQFDRNPLLKDTSEFIALLIEDIKREAREQVDINDQNIPTLRKMLGKVVADYIKGQHVP